MRRRVAITTQVGALVAAACFGAGSASLGIPPSVGIPLLGVGGLVTLWVVWKIWSEDRARKMVRQLLTAMLRRLRAHEQEAESGDVAVETIMEFFHHEQEWVRAALGEIEATLLLDFTRHPSAMFSREEHPVITSLRGVRLNLTILNERLPTIDLESNFKPREWQDRL